MNVIQNTRSNAIQWSHSNTIKQSRSNAIQKARSNAIQQPRSNAIQRSHSNAIQQLHGERSGSMEECLTRDQRAAGSSLTGVTALWSLSKTHLSYLSTGSTQEDPSLLTERLLM